MMAVKKRTIEELIALSPHQFAGASRVITDAQREKMRESSKRYWSLPHSRSRHSELMSILKKDWSWNGTRAGGQNPKARPVVTPLGEFGSVAEAAKAFGLTSEGIRHRIMHKWPGYAFKGQEVYQGPKRYNRCYRWVLTPDGKFFTLVAAAKALGVTTVTIRDRIKRNVPGYAYLVR